MRPCAKNLYSLEFMFPLIPNEYDGAVSRIMTAIPDKQGILIKCGTLFLAVPNTFIVDIFHVLPIL